MSHLLYWPCRALLHPSRGSPRGVNLDLSLRVMHKSNAFDVPAFRLVPLIDGPVVGGSVSDVADTP